MQKKTKVLAAVLLCTALVLAFTACAGCTDDSNKQVSLKKIDSLSSSYGTMTAYQADPFDTIIKCNNGAGSEIEVSQEYMSYTSTPVSIYSCYDYTELETSNGNKIKMITAGDDKGTYVTTNGIEKYYAPGVKFTIDNLMNGVGASGCYYEYGGLSIITGEFKITGKGSMTIDDTDVHIDVEGYSSNPHIFAYSRNTDSSTATSWLDAFSKGVSQGILGYDSSSKTGFAFQRTKAGSSGLFSSTPSEYALTKYINGQATGSIKITSE